MNKKIAVVGDLIIDKFINYKSLRISPEAPVPVVEKTDSWEKFGGAGNVAISLRNLGLNIKFYFPFNNENNNNPKFSLIEDLKKIGIKIFKLDTNIKDITPFKTRFYIDNKQQMREDIENKSRNLSVIDESYINNLVKDNDIILASDYQKGCLNTESMQKLICLCELYKKPIFIDTKNQSLDSIKNAFCLKINHSEFNSLFKEFLFSEHEEINKIKEKVRKAKLTYNVKNLIVTLGSKGCVLAAEKLFYSPALKVEVIDITGAGDAFISAIVFSFLKKSFVNKTKLFDTSLDIDILDFANNAASSVLNTTGTAAINKNFTKSYFKKSNSHKIIGFTNGCFDLFHLGHISLLNEAKKYCDYLIVGLNSDKSVRKIKGKDRPLNNQFYRAKLLESLNIVDEVILFEEETPEKLIKEIKPDVLIKGSDYKEHEIIGGKFVNSYGGEIIRIELVKDISSSKLIEKLNNI